MIIGGTLLLKSPNGSGWDSDLISPLDSQNLFEYFLQDIQLKWDVDTGLPIPVTLVQWAIVALGCPELPGASWVSKVALLSLCLEAQQNWRGLCEVEGGGAGLSSKQRWTSSSSMGKIDTAIPNFSGVKGMADRSNVLTRNFGVWLVRLADSVLWWCCYLRTSLKVISKTSNWKGLKAVLFLRSDDPDPQQCRIPCCGIP